MNYTKSTQPLFFPTSSFIKVLAVCALLMIGSIFSDLQGEVDRGIFVWDSAPLLGSNSAAKKARKAVFEFCAQPHGRTDRPIRTLYLCAYIDRDDRSLEKQAREFAQFLREAHRSGLKVEYLSAIGPLANEKEKEVTLLELDMILEYNKSRPPEERWDGIHYDIEPHTTPEWKNDSSSIWARNRSFFQEARLRVDQYLQEDPSDFKLGLDIPTFHTRKRLQDIFESMDYAGLMNYHDRPQVMIKMARPTLEAAESMGKKVKIYTECMSPTEAWGVGKSNTFAEEGHEYLEHALDQFLLEFRDHPAFGGFGYHQLQTYRNLPAKGYPIRSQNSFDGVINRFNHSENDLEGTVETPFSPPSSITSSLASARDAEPNNRCLRIDYIKKPNSFCGWVTVLVVGDQLVDISKYSHIRFKVRGKRGGELFTIGLADQRWYELQDFVQSPQIDNYLPNGVTTQWQEVKVPLSYFSTLKLKKIAMIGVHFNCRPAMKGTIYIDDLRFE